jgi:hypothetical protein
MKTDGVFLHLIMTPDLFGAYVEKRIALKMLEDAKYNVVGLTLIEMEQELDCLGR